MTTQASPEDLRWWLISPRAGVDMGHDLADFAPHWYVVHGRTPG